MKKTKHSPPKCLKAAARYSIEELAEELFNLQATDRIAVKVIDKILEPEILERKSHPCLALAGLLKAVEEFILMAPEKRQNEFLQLLKFIVNRIADSAKKPPAEELAKT